MSASPPWWEGLPPETLRELRARHPTLTLTEIAIEAMRRPGYAAAFKALGAETETYEEHKADYEASQRNPSWIVIPEPPEEFPRLWVPEKNRVAFRDLVVSVLLEDDDADESQADDLVVGLAYLKADYDAAGKLHKAGKMTVDGIKKRRELSTKRAHRIYRQFDADAVLFDDAGLHPGPGYRWDPFELDNDPPRYKLIRA